MRFDILAAATILVSLPPSLAQGSLPSLEDVLMSAENLVSFRDLLTAQFPELVANLSSQGEPQQYVTLLAPSDDAFERLASSSLGSAIAENDTETIESVLNYHVVPGDHQFSAINQSFAFFPTRLDNIAYTNVNNGQRLGFVKQGDSELIVLSGGGTRSRVEEQDIYFSGGVMHVIEALALRPQPLVEAAIPFNLTGFLGSVYQNESLAQLVTEAGDVTIFVPNNFAFEQVGSTITSIDGSSLSSLLEYHIILGEGGPFYSSSFSNGTIYPTLQGGNITIRQASNSNFVNSARVLQTDLLIANGVMHVIDNVLNPNGTGAIPNPAIGPQGPAMTGSRLADTPFTSVIPSLTSTLSFTSTSPTTGADDGTETGTVTTGTGSTRRSSSTQSSSTGESTRTGTAPRKLGLCMRLLVVVCVLSSSWMYL